MLIPMHLTIFDFLFSWSSFPSANFEQFGQFIFARWAKMGQISSISLTLKGESHSYNSFPKIEYFTLFRSNVEIHHKEITHSVSRNENPEILFLLIGKYWPGFMETKSRWKYLDDEGFNCSLTLNVSILDSYDLFLKAEEF